jgi:hypothetical protein
LKAALSAGDFDYHCFLSGCDYPIKPVRAFEAYLAAHAGNEYIQCCDMNKLAPRLKKRYTGFFLFSARSTFLKNLNFGITKIQRSFYKRKPYNNSPMFYGSQWWTLTNACVKHIINLVETCPSYENYFKYTFLSDEMFFQTMVMYTPFARHVKNDNLRYVVFEGKNPHPKVRTMADKEALLQSPAYFARKFDLSADSRIVEFLKQHLNK